MFRASPTHKFNEAQKAKTDRYEPETLIAAISIAVVFSIFAGYGIFKLVTWIGNMIS